jgi:hypothetical protein
LPYQISRAYTSRRMSSDPVPFGRREGFFVDPERARGRMLLQIGRKVWYPGYQRYQTVPDAI